MPDFVVIQRRPGLPVAPAPPGVWGLRPERVNDDGLETTYTLVWSDPDRGEVEIGVLKIGRAGTELGRTPLPASFTRLDDEFVSVGADLEYYEQLRRIAGQGAADVLDSLRDMAVDAGRRARFTDASVVRRSLLRFTPARTALEAASDIMAGERRSRRVTGAGLVFRTSTGGDGFVLELAFGADGELPDRINVLVGPNGSGKTRLLANLALAAFDPVDPPTADRPWGSVADGLSLSRILAFSYSAFDDFDVPDAGDSREAILERGRGLGYSYFGLRDLHGSPDDGSVLLKSQQRITAEFRAALAEAIDRDTPLMRTLLGELFVEPSLSTAALMDPSEIEDLDPGALADRLTVIFGSASTGHKFVLLMTAQLVAQVREGSLILVDEPEAHLHPPLLAVFLRVMRNVLDARASWGIIATHSPFVVQETPSRYVHVISRYVTETTATVPEIETFGEDVGTITREVFRLDTRTGEYVELLRGLARRFTLDQIEALFDTGLSSQARSLVVAAQRRARA